MKKIAPIFFSILMLWVSVADAKKKDPTKPFYTPKQDAIIKAVNDNDVKYLMEQCTPEELKAPLISNVTYLHLAVLNENVETVVYLVEEIKISPNAKSETGSTPTTIAGYKYHITKSAGLSLEKAKKILGYLIEHGGDPDLKTLPSVDSPNGMSAKDWAPEFFQ